MDYSCPGCVNKTTEGYLRPHDDVCARLRAISCPSRRSASSCNGSSVTVYISAETPGYDPRRVSHSSQYERYVEMLRKKCVETLAMPDASREYTHRHGLQSMMNNAALVSTLSKRDRSNEAVCQNSPGPADHACIEPPHTQQ